MRSQQLATTDKLNVLERRKLKQLEEIIETGITSGIAMGAALTVVQDEKLYREEYKTFESYVQTRWGIERRRAYQLIEAAKVKAILCKKLHKESDVITNESQLRELSDVPAESMQEVIEKAVELAGEDRMTTKTITQAKAEVLEAKPDPKPEPVQDVWEDVPDQEPATESEPSPQALQAPIQAVATQLTGILKELKRLADHVGGEWLDLTDLETQITALKYSIRQSIYWMDCMDCDGKGCKTCHKHGWLSLDRKKHLTQEQKDKVSG